MVQLAPPDHRTPTPAWHRRTGLLALVSIAFTAGAIALCLTLGLTLGLTVPAVDRGTVTVTNPKVSPLPTTSAPTPTPAAAAHGATEGKRQGKKQGFDLTKHSTTDPYSIWVVVNKRRPVAADHVPDLALVRGHRVAVTAAEHLARMLDASDRHGLGLKIVSGYRSYARQQTLHSRAVTTRGPAHADAFSARPGHSEHQTGLAVDVATSHSEACTLRPCFGNTAAGRWLAQESWRYGFIVRYTGANRAVTGFDGEPWHLRYVGRGLAREMHQQNASSLEEFLGVQGGDYRDRR